MNEQFRKILNKIKPAIFDDPYRNLVETGILDSLDIMAIVAECEKAFGISFDPDDILPDNFATIADIWALVEKYIKEQSKK